MMAAPPGDDGVEVLLTRQSLGIWIDEWLKVWCHGIAERTREDYRRILKRYLPPDLRRRQLPNLSAAGEEVTITQRNEEKSLIQQRLYNRPIFRAKPGH